MDLLNVALLALNTTFDDSWSLDRDIRTTENSLSEVSTIDSDYGSGLGSGSGSDSDYQQEFLNEVTTVSYQNSHNEQSKNIFKGENLAFTIIIFVLLAFFMLKCCEKNLEGCCKCEEPCCQCSCEDPNYTYV